MITGNLLHLISLLVEINSFSFTEVHLLLLEVLEKLEKGNAPASFSLAGALAEYHESIRKRVSRFVLGSRRNVEFTHSLGAGRYADLCAHFRVNGA